MFDDEHSVDLNLNITYNLALGIVLMIVDLGCFPNYLGVPPILKQSVGAYGKARIANPRQRVNVNKKVSC
jgi:hypothetical protein